jgi:hypothetical protein
MHRQLPPPQCEAGSISGPTGTTAVSGDIADVAIAQILAPGPTLLALENENVIAEQGLALAHAVRARIAVHRSDRIAHAHRHPRDKAGRPHPPLKPGVGKVWPKRIEPAVEVVRHQLHPAAPRPTMPSIAETTARAVWTSPPFGPSARCPWRHP